MKDKKKCFENVPIFYYDYKENTQLISNTKKKILNYIIINNWEEKDFTRFFFKKSVEQSIKQSKSLKFLRGYFRFGKKCFHRL